MLIARRGLSCCCAGCTCVCLVVVYEDGGTCAMGSLLLVVDFGRIVKVVSCVKCLSIISSLLGR